MGHKNKDSLVRQIQLVYDSKLAIGDSKHQAKREGGIQDKIFSWETYRSYMKHANYFAKYCKEEHGCKTLDQCRPYVDEWLKSREDLSAYTLKLEAASLAKLYGCSTTAFEPTKSRNRDEITRSRGEAKRDYGFSLKKNADIISFAESTGLRREGLSKVTGDCLIYKDEKPYICITEKGGRYREAPVIGDVALVERLCKAAGEGKVFDHVPSHMDVHGYRAVYGTRVYESVARSLEECKADHDFYNKEKGRKDQNAVYWCRGSKKGVWYDKRAMEAASEALGHSRISVVGEHYLRNDG